MIRKFMVTAVLLAVPGLLAAQNAPNANASSTAKSKVAVHQQNPQVPAPEASDVAKAKVSQRRATRVRGSAVGLEHRPVTPAAPAMPATRATQPATPAVPASPSRKPATPGRP